MMQTNGLREGVEQVASMDIDIGKINVFLYQGQIAPGDSIRGHVELNLYQDSMFRGIWVKFAGFTTVRHARKGARRDEPKKFTTIDILQDDNDHFYGGIHDVFLGLGEVPEGEENLHEDALVTVPSGKHCWDFTFNVPADAPLSYIDTESRTMYSIQVVADTPMVSKAVCTSVHYISVAHRRRPSLEEGVMAVAQAALGARDTPSLDIPTEGCFAPEYTIIGEAPLHIVDNSWKSRAKTFARQLLGKMTTSGGKASTKSKTSSSNGDSSTAPSDENVNPNGQALSLPGIIAPSKSKKVNPNHGPPILATLQSAKVAVMEYADALNSLQVEVNISEQNVTPGMCLEIRARLYQMTVYTSQNQRANHLRPPKQRKLWEDSLPIASGREGTIYVPIKLNASTRNAALKEWPVPTVPSHKAGRLDAFSFTSKLVSNRIILEVCLIRKDTNKQLGSTARGEVLVLPPLATKPHNPILGGMTTVAPTHVPPALGDYATESGLATPRMEQSHTMRQYSFTPGTPHSTTRTSARKARSHSKAGRQAAAAVRPKVPTPCAVPMITRVKAEVLSRGPAAVIHDRRLEANDVATPQHYAAITRVANYNSVTTVIVPQQVTHFEESPVPAFLHINDGGRFTATTPRLSTTLRGTVNDAVVATAASDTEEHEGGHIATNDPHRSMAARFVNTALAQAQGEPVIHSAIDEMEVMDTPRDGTAAFSSSMRMAQIGMGSHEHTPEASSSSHASRPSIVGSEIEVVRALHMHETSGVEAHGDMAVGVLMPESEGAASSSSEDIFVAPTHTSTLTTAAPGADVAASNEWEGYASPDDMDEAEYADHASSMRLSSPRRQAMLEQQAEQRDGQSDYEAVSRLASAVVHSVSEAAAMNMARRPSSHRPSRTGRPTGGRQLMSVR